MGLGRGISTWLRAELVPWIWIPVILLMSFEYRIGNATVTGLYLIIPLAVMLGVRYRRRGLVAVALGGLLFPIRLMLFPGLSGPHLDIYPIALVVCALAGSERPLRGWAPAIQSPLRFFATFLLLPLAIGLYGRAISDAIEIKVAFDFQPVFYLFLFMVGLSRSRSGFVVTTLAVATLAGILLEMAGLPVDARALFNGSWAELPVYGFTNLRYLSLAYGLDSPAEFFTGLGYFLVGRLFGAMIETGHLPPQPWYRAYGLIAVLALLALGGELNDHAVAALTGLRPASHFRLLGSFFALPLAALLGGLLVRYWGILLLLPLVVLF